MKTTRLSLLLAGLATMAGGCQPEESTQAPTSALGTQQAALTAGTWTTNANSLQGHPGGHTATLLRGPGDVLVTEGSGAEMYNPYTNAWRTTTALSTARHDHTATEMPSGKVLAIGGRSSNGLTLHASAELYDPTTETWSATASMATGHSQHSTVLLDSGKVLVVGGKQPTNRGGPVGPATELYDPDTNTWSTPSGLFTPRSRASTTVLYSGKVLVTGGYLWFSVSPTATAEMSLYDPATNAWSLVNGLSQARHGHSAIRLYSGVVLIVGGMGGGNTVELYNPYSGQVTLGPSLPFSASPSLTATLLYTGEVLVTDTGGQAALYDPSTNTWLPASSMNLSRLTTTATLLHTGEVLFVGGDSASPNAVERFTR